MIFKKFLKEWKKQKFYVKLLLLFVVCGIIVYFYYSEYYSVKIELIEGKSAELKRLSDIVAENEKIASNLSLFKKDVKLLEIKLTDLMNKLPKDPNIADLLRRLAFQAQKSGLSFIKFLPNGIFQSGFYSEIVVSMNFEGTFHQMIAFFDRVSKLERIVNIKKIQLAFLQAPSIDNINLSGTSMVVSYMFNDGSQGQSGEESKSGDEANKSKRKRRIRAKL